MERELLLLGLLRRQQMHGYELYDFVENTMQMCVDLKKPTAYYLLDKLASAGHIVSTDVQSGNRPTRKVYTITEQGEVLFQELLQQNLAQYDPAHFSNTVGLVFLDELDPVKARSLLQQRRHALVALLDEAKAVPAHRGALQYAISHQVAHLGAELEWLDSVIADVGEVTPCGD